jgi:hypothetical protein
MEIFQNPGCFGYKKWKEWDFSSSEYQHCQKKLKGVLRWPDNNSMFRRLSCNRATSKE